MKQPSPTRTCRKCGKIFKAYSTIGSLCFTCTRDREQIKSLKKKKRKIITRTPGPRSYKTSKHWKEPDTRTREKQNAKIRDNFVCKMKGEIAHECGGQLESHHILYISQGGPDELWNLICICHNAHRLVHVSDKHETQVRLLEIVNGADWRAEIDRVRIIGEESLKTPVYIRRLDYLASLSTDTM